MRRLLRPGHNDVRSRAWQLYVNTIAASPYVSSPTRIAIYRRFGIRIDARYVHPRCYFHSSEIRIGADVTLNAGVHIENVAHVEIGARSALGLHTRVLTSTHELGPHSERPGRWLQQPVTVGEGCWIGAGCLLLPGVRIGDGCLVAAGSVVREDCEPDALYAGVPARRVRQLPP